MTMPCNHVWDGPRIEVSAACSVATCSKCGEPAIDIKSLQRAETPVQPEAHENSSTAVQPEAHENSNPEPKSEK